MVEGKGSPLRLAFQHELGKLLILLLDNLEILFGERRRIPRGTDHRFHAQFRKAQVQHGPDILQEVGVPVGKGSAHVIVFAAAGPDQLLKLRHNPLPASVSGVIHPEAVVDLLPSVEREHDVAHLAIAEVDHIIVDEHAVGCEGKAEVLAGLLLPDTGIGHQLFHRVEVHQRFPAEEIDLQVPARSGVLDQEVQRPFPHFRAHHRAFAVVLSLAGKTVRAVEVAGMRHMQTERFDHVPASRLELARHRGKVVRGE